MGMRQLGVVLSRAIRRRCFLRNRLFNFLFTVRYLLTQPWEAPSLLAQRVSARHSLLQLKLTKESAMCWATVRNERTLSASTRGLAAGAVLKVLCLSSGRSKAAGL